MRYHLFPLALAYSAVLRIRHLLFDIGIVRSHSFDLPVIGIGNISLGGTGKTPHTEYLVRLLQSDYRIAILSRGYKRRTKGFLLADAHTTARDIGDEPRQYVKKFPDVLVAVDEKRVRGIRCLLKHTPQPDLILLDDAYQHRRVKPGLEILLTEYSRVFSKDYLVPAGRLRDLKSAAVRAPVVVITKTPKVFSHFLQVDLMDKLKPVSHQLVFFSYIEYGTIRPVRNTKPVTLPRKLANILLVTGIANTRDLVTYLQAKCSFLTHKDYPDHHQFTEKDILDIVHTFTYTIGSNKIIVTTEKDAARLEESPYFRHLKDLPVFYIPIEVKFHQTGEVSFDDYILDYVTSHSKNH